MQIYHPIGTPSHTHTRSQTFVVKCLFGAEAALLGMGLFQERHPAGLDDRAQWKPHHLTPQLDDISWNCLPLGGPFNLCQLCTCQLLHPRHESDPRQHAFV